MVYYNFFIRGRRGVEEPACNLRRDGCDFISLSVNEMYDDDDDDVCNIIFSFIAGPFRHLKIF